MHTQASFNDGISAASHAARVSPQGDMLRIFSQDGHVLADWAMPDIRADNPAAKPLRLRSTSSDSQRLTVQDDTAIETVLVWLAPTLRAGRSSRRKAWLAGIVAVWLAVGAIWFAAPYGIGAIVTAIPVRWEHTLGEEARTRVGSMLSTKPEEERWLEHAPQAKPLHDLVQRLAQAADTADYQLSVSLLQADLVNAFALPGGRIIVTTGLIRQCRNADELAGVLAHEMGHVTERHNTRRLVREQLFEVLVRMLASGSDALTTVGRGSSALFSGAFSRNDERAADLLGVHRLAAAGIDPLSGSRFFESLPYEQKVANEADTILSYLASHPALSERQAAIGEAAARYKGPFTPALTPQEWILLRSLARVHVPGDEV